MSISDAYASGGTFGDVVASGRPHQYAAVAALRPYHLLDGITARAVHGEHITLSVVDLAPGLSMNEHRHANEQVGIVVRGELTFTIGGETRRCGTGDMWVIPPGVPHLVTVGDSGCTVVETFSPPREDWAGLPRLDAGPGAWPEPGAAGR
jgi:quercetin dioxygenase-like cupin family protein